LRGLRPGDAWCFPAFDVVRKSGAPGGRSRGVVVGCRCPSPPPSLELFDRTKSCGGLESRTAREMTDLGVLRLGRRVSPPGTTAPIKGVMTPWACIAESIGPLTITTSRWSMTMVMSWCGGSANHIGASSAPVPTLTVSGCSFQMKESVRGCLVRFAERIEKKAGRVKPP
jgi:hypothetical protein